MAKIVLNDALGTYNVTQINLNASKIEDELNNKVLYRDNPDGEPNTMETPLDMNGQRLYNLPKPTGPGQPARFEDVVMGSLGEEVVGEILEDLEDLQASSGIPNDGAVTDVKVATSLWNRIGRVIANITELRALDKTRFSAVLVKGYYSAHDGGGGTFYYDSTDTVSADNGGSVIVAADGGRWKRDFKGPANVRWFGAKGDGIQNDRPMIQSAINVHASVFIPATSTYYYMDDQVQMLRDGQELFGEGFASQIRVLDGTVNAIYGDGVDKIVIRDLSVETVSQTNATVYKGAVVIANSDGWLVTNVTARNMGYWGVGLIDSTNCRVFGNRIYPGFGTVQDSADIALLNNSSYNDVEGNYCYNTAAWHGIFIQDTYSGATPTGNRIRFNFIDGQLGDGISVYTPTAYNTRTLIEGNDIRNIQGMVLGGLSGHGIYIQSVGGTRAVHNTIVNCARFTTGFETQVVAGIGIAIGEYLTGVLTVVDVSHNHIVMSRGPCIAAVTSAVPVHITHNYCEQAGTEAVRSECIRTVNARRAHITHNTCKQLNPNYQTIGVIASGQTFDGGVIAYNDLLTVKYGIQVAGVGGGTFSALSYGGNHINGGDDQGTSVAEVTNLRFYNNYINSTGIAAVFSNCPGARITGGNVITSLYAPYAVIFSGTMTGSICDESNTLPGRVENGGGVIITRYAAAPPIAGNVHGVGDRTINSAPAIGQPKAWTCTTAGVGGVSVHTSEGNL